MWPVARQKAKSSSSFSTRSRALFSPTMRAGFSPMHRIGLDAIRVLLDRPIEEAADIAEQIAGMGRCPRCLTLRTTCRTSSTGDVGDRPLTPDGHEFLAHIALDVPALPLAGELLLGEILEHGGDRILAPAGRGKLNFTLMLGGIDPAGNELEPLAGLLPGLLKAHGIA